MATQEATITTLICKACGHETSGPDTKSVQDAHRRHQKKNGHMLTTKKIEAVATAVEDEVVAEAETPVEEVVSVDIAEPAEESAEEAPAEEAPAEEAPAEEAPAEEAPAEEPVEEEAASA